MSSSSIFALPTSVIFVITGIVGLFVGIPVLLVGVSVWVSTRRASKNNEADGIGTSAVRRARIGRISGLIAGAVLGVLTFFATNGLLAPAFVGVGYLLGMLVFELRPSSQPTGPVRVASLQVRSAWQYLPRWVIRCTVVVTLLTVVAPVAFAVVPVPAVSSRGQVVELAVPLAAMGAVALIAWIALMNRIARLPQPAGESSDSGLVAATRANAARAITGAVLGIGLLSLAGVITVTSSAVDLSSHGAGYVIGRILIGLAQGLAVAGLVGWAILSRWRSVPVEPTEPAPVEPRIA
jgi:hypothetical protein